jgi:hypothetical protein
MAEDEIFKETFVGFEALKVNINDYVQWAVNEQITLIIRMENALLVENRSLQDRFLQAPVSW